MFPNLQLDGVPTSAETVECNVFILENKKMWVGAKQRVFEVWHKKHGRLRGRLHWLHDHCSVHLHVVCVLLS